MENPDKFERRTSGAYRLVIFIIAIVVIASIGAIYIFNDPGMSYFNSQNTEPGQEAVSENTDDYNKVENGIHVRTGLVDAPGLMATVNNCTTCHSAKLVIQNRMDKARWISTIRWMQKTQNLWDLGDNEEVIVNYLVTNYPPKKKGRREALTGIEWYRLKD